VEKLLARVKVYWWMFIAGRKRKHEQYAEAFEVLQKVIALEPHRALALLRTGFCLAKLNRHQEALNSYERALQVAPNYGDAHAYIGLAYYDLGRNRESLESINRAIRMKPGLTDDPYWLSHVGAGQWKCWSVGAVACGFYETNWV
jgi:tetratricopeptide (TPR) repeat protein